MVFSALIAALLAPFASALAAARLAVGAYVAANLWPFLLRITPLVLFALVLYVEYATGSVAERWKVGTLAVTAVLAALDVAGKLPTITITR